MIGQKLLSFLAATMLVAAFVAHAQSANPVTPELVVGQMWSIKSASHTTAKIIIGRIEPWNGKVAVHVSIVDIPIPRGMHGAGGVTRIDHVPFEKAALAASVDKLLENDMSTAPDFESGYQQWHSDKRAGIYTISVSQAIELMFESLNRDRG